MSSKCSMLGSEGRMRISCVILQRRLARRSDLTRCTGRVGGVLFIKFDIAMATVPEEPRRGVTQQASVRHARKKTYSRSVLQEGLRPLCDGSTDVLGKDRVAKRRGRKVGKL